MRIDHLRKALAQAEELRDAVGEMENSPEFYKLANLTDSLVEVLSYVLKRDEYRLLSRLNGEPQPQEAA
jgi:hypothetical protein